MKTTVWCGVAALLLAASQGALASEPEGGDGLAAGVRQLRESIGRWDTLTEFLNEDGSVANAVTGSYEFSWVVPDRVVAGRSEIPELGQSAGILFYVNEKKAIIEMVSVGADGRLWVMTGPIDGETRTSQTYEAQDGSQGQLRFTRFHVAADRFESKMEYTSDGGKTWKPGNHQVFTRAAETPDAS